MTWTWRGFMGRNGGMILAGISAGIQGFGFAEGDSRVAAPVCGGGFWEEGDVEQDLGIKRQLGENKEDLTEIPGKTPGQFPNPGML